MHTPFVTLYLDRFLSFYQGDSGVNILGNHVSTVEETTCHVLSVSGVTFHHLKHFT